MIVGKRGPEIVRFHSPVSRSEIVSLIAIAISLYVIFCK